MSKKYVCDICNKVIDDPYHAKMREFYVGAGFEDGHVCPINIKTFKFKIDICGNCFETLRKAASKKEEN